MSNIELQPGFDFQQAGKEVLQIEREGLAQLDSYINADFTRACETIAACGGKVVVMGMGKSGHIGCKIAATFASTGTPSFFVHPAEASHGDLGMVTPQDIVLAISNSGESSEILALIPVLKRQQITLICMTNNPESSMGKAADIHLCIKVPQEACPLGLAPTTSTTATLVMGDALAVALLKARGFTPEDFALSHPGGALGRKLLLRVSDIMHSGDEMPHVSADASLRDALLEITRKKSGPDGDLRRSDENRRHLHRWRPAPGVRHGHQPARGEDRRRHDAGRRAGAPQYSSGRCIEPDATTPHHRAAGCRWRPVAGCGTYA
uniref:arabinose-5-phosphate isomerase n=1 Tax=Serratia marcescens TaxID=615 RepID=A0A1C3HJI9_SERMA|nr:Arabinose 5-phosphate isomerase KdsD [Serratia marcescens]